jgi:hypothetical protein
MAWEVRLWRHPLRLCLQAHCPCVNPASFSKSRLY